MRCDLGTPRFDGFVLERTDPGDDFQAPMPRLYDFINLPLDMPDLAEALTTQEGYLVFIYLPPKKSPLM